MKWRVVGCDGKLRVEFDVVCVLLEFLGKCHFILREINQTAIELTHFTIVFILYS